MVVNTSAVNESGYGIWLQDCGDYYTLIPRDYQQGDELEFYSLEIGKEEFRRGELLLKLASLNSDVVVRLKEFFDTVIMFHGVDLLDSLTNHMRTRCYI